MFTGGELAGTLYQWCLSQCLLTDLFHHYQCSSVIGCALTASLNVIGLVKYRCQSTFINRDDICTSCQSFILKAAILMP